MIPFLIIFEGRTGSSYLTSLLNSHPDALCYPEIMKGLDAYTQSQALRRIARGKDLRKLNKYAGTDLYHQEGFAEKWRQRPFDAVGTKTKLLDTLDQEAFLADAHALDYRMIYLHRRNVLKSVVSIINSQLLHATHRVWNATEAEQVAVPIRIELADLDQRIEKRQRAQARHRAAYDAYPGQKILMCYEDLLGDRPAFLARLFAFLDLPDAVLESRFQKNTADDLRTAISNYDEVAAHFAGTEMAAFLDEAPAG